MTINCVSMLALMFLLHIFADFNLQIQSKLDKFKQKRWWDEQIPKKRRDLRDMYRNDYKVALYLHGFFWAAVVCLPLLFCVGPHYAIQTIAHGLFHGWIDDKKANREVFNLVQDQAIHAIQVVFIWACWLIAS